MGLDIRVTYKKASSDEELMDMEQNFCGRTMFECVRHWVGDERYGRDILLYPGSADYRNLKEALVRTAADVIKDDEDDIDCSSPLIQLTRLVGEAEILSEIGIDMYIECDW